MLEFSIHLPILTADQAAAAIFGNRDIADVTTYERQQQNQRLPAGRRFLRHRLERLSLKLPVLLQQDFHFAFRLF